MTRYLKGWKRILDKDNTNRCSWYEFQDPPSKAQWLYIAFIDLYCLSKRVFLVQVCVSYMV